MVQKTALTHARMVEGVSVSYRVEPLIRDVKPFAPAGLLWLFPFERLRAIEMRKEKERGRGKKKGFLGVKDTRIATFLCSVALFFTTLLLTVSGHLPAPQPSRS